MVLDLRHVSELLVPGFGLVVPGHKLSSVGIGGSVLSVLSQFLSNRSQYVSVDGCRSKLVNVVSGVPQGSVLGQLLFFCTPRNFFPFWRII